MMSPSFIFGSEFSVFILSIYLMISFFSSYANQSTCFISAYYTGLSGSQAAWANQKYHSHHSLPPDIISDVKHSVLSWYSDS